MTTTTHKISRTSVPHSNLDVIKSWPCFPVTYSISLGSCYLPSLHSCVLLCPITLMWHVLTIQPVPVSGILQLLHSTQDTHLVITSIYSGSWNLSSPTCHTCHITDIWIFWFLELIIFWPCFPFIFHTMVTSTPLPRFLELLSVLKLGKLSRPWPCHPVTLVMFPCNSKSLQTYGPHPNSDDIKP